ILAKLEPPNDAPYKVVDELMLNTLELVTGVCSRVDAGLEQLATAATQLLDVLPDHRFGLYATGTHPFADAFDETISSHIRYQKMLSRTQYWGQQMLIYGVHAHIGLDHVGKAMPAVNHLIKH